MARYRPIRIIGTSYYIKLVPQDISDKHIDPKNDLIDVDSGKVIKNANQEEKSEENSKTEMKGGKKTDK